jgi:hypothetical protein
VSCRFHLSTPQGERIDTLAAIAAAHPLGRHGPGSDMTNAGNVKVSASLVRHRRFHWRPGLRRSMLRRSRGWGRLACRVTEPLPSICHMHASGKPGRGTVRANPPVQRDLFSQDRE